MGARGNALPKRKSALKKTSVNLAYQARRERTLQEGGFSRSYVMDDRVKT
jgi:hypothetical protein